MPRALKCFLFFNLCLELMFCPEEVVTDDVILFMLVFSVTTLMYYAAALWISRRETIHHARGPNTLVLPDLW